MIACAENLDAQFYDHSNYKHRTYQHEGKIAAFVTWSDWDLGQCLQQECNRKCIRKPRQFESWIDLRLLYRNFYKRSPTCLRDAVENVGLKFEGQEHSGICDSRNTAALARKMIVDGCTLRVTRTIERNGRKVHVIPPANSMLAALDRVKKDQAKGNGERLPKKPRLGVNS